MTALAPLFIWLLPLALTPVVFHLFFRVRKQPRTFSSLMFFLASDPRLSARRKLREWLVLALRCLALLALLLALARPVRRGSGGGGDTALMAVVDNSASMAGVGRDGQSRLSRALAGAAALLDDADVKLAGVVTCVRDPLASLPEGLAADRTALRTALASVRLTHAAGQPATALAAALAAVRGGMRESAEVHLFTDLQANEWDRPAASLDLPPGVRVVVHDVSSEHDAVGTVALEPVAAPGRRLIAGRPWRLTARVRNAADRDAEVTLNALTARADERQRAVTAVPGGEARTAELAFKGLPAGLTPMRVWLEGAAAAPASEAWLALHVSTGELVWLLGMAADHGLLAAALAPSGDGRLTGLLVEAKPLAGLAAGLRSTPPRLVAATERQLAAPGVADACRAYVAAGGTLLVSPDRALPPAPVPLPDWCGAQWEQPRRTEAGLPMLVVAAGDVLWNDLRNTKGEVVWRGVQLQQAVPLKVVGAQALAGTADGAAVLTRSALGAGVVYVSGVAWDPRWSNLPRKATFLVLAQALALAHGRAADDLAAVAGRRIEWRDAIAPTSTVPVRVRALAGDMGEWSVAASEAPAAPVRAGVYELVREGGSVWLSVAGDSSEADPRHVRGDAVPLLGPLPHHIERYQGAAATALAARKARHGRSLFGPLLLLSVAALVAEALLAGAWPWRGRTEERKNGKTEGRKR